MALLAVPNVSEGRDRATIAAIGEAYATAGARLLDTHSDADHNRSVHTLTAAPGQLAQAVLAGAREAVARIDLNAHAGVHPHIGAIDVAPVVHLDAATRGAACAEALVLADLLASNLNLPVFLYGVLAEGRTRAELRRGGLKELTQSMQAGALKPDFGPSQPHPTAGAVLVAARPPLVAFNLILSQPMDLATGKSIAALIRETGAEGLPGVRALGLQLPLQHAVQLSFNLEDPAATPLNTLIAAVRRHADIDSAELVGLAPEVSFAHFPTDLPIPGFEPDRHLIERVLAAPVT